jgi:hypothetical protein
LRLLGLVYFVAFLVAAQQNQGLLGSDGLTPVQPYLEALRSNGHGPWDVPSLFWLNPSDTALNSVAWVGTGLSLLVLGGLANAAMMAVLWALYMSIVHVGQDWYSFGWEIQLLETGFLAIFLCPLLDPRPFPRSAPPTPVIWLFRWLGFRIMVGAGLIKLRGDACWRDLSCLDYHFETQPVPNPVSPWLDHLPHPILHAGVLWNFCVELVAPWFSFGPRRARHVAGLIMLSFQVFLIVSGNLAFLNWLTMVPFLACLDDTFWARWLPRRLVQQADAAANGSVAPGRVQQGVAWTVFALVAVLSVGPVKNLLSPSQAMNTSFDPLDLVNTYGAFGSVGRERDEIIVEGTSDTTLGPHTVWREYAFKAKPGDPYRRPCIITPYHYRLDWLMWFAAMGTPDDYPWTVHLLWKLLHNDTTVLALLDGNPFPHSPPHAIRMMLYHYQFTPPGDTSGRWWDRSNPRVWMPPVTVDNPSWTRILAQYGWH